MQLKTLTIITLGGNKMFFGLVLLFAAILFGISNTLTAAGNEESDQLFLKALQSEKRVVITAQKMIDSGEYAMANRLLIQAEIKFPNRDLLLALRGESLFLSRQIDESEAFFMRALSINQQNEVAKKYIAEIRNIRSLSTSEELQAWLAIGKDKFADFLVLVVSIWLGTTINSIGGAFSRWRFNKESRKAFQCGNYDDLTDLLEQKIKNYDPASVRDILRFMLRERNGQEEEVKKILEDYVEYKEHLDTLLRILHRCAIPQSSRIA